MKFLKPSFLLFLFVFGCVTLKANSGSPKLLSSSGKGCIGDTLKLAGDSKISKITWMNGSTVFRTDTFSQKNYGVTVAGQANCSSGNDSTTLYYIAMIFIDKKLNVYVADQTNSRVQKWVPGAKYGITVAGNKSGNSGTDSFHLDIATGVCVDSNANVFATDEFNNRVQKWSPGTKYGKTVAGSKSGYKGTGASQLTDPLAVSLDDSGNFYVSDLNRIQKWAPGSTSGVTVAGNSSGTRGTDSLTLYGEWGTFIDAKGNLYIADEYNNRVQEWKKGAKYGITVAGNKAGKSGSDSAHLYHPRGVCVDSLGNIYVADDFNNRVQKWAPGATYGVTVAGTGVSGTDSVHLREPIDVKIGVDGNLYISEFGNNRVQKWVSDMCPKVPASIIKKPGTYHAVLSYLGGARVYTDTFVVDSFVTKIGKDTTVCENEKVQLGGKGLKNHSYSWTSNPLAFTSSSSQVTITPGKTGIYYLLETDAHGCSHNDSVKIIVNGLPAANAGSNMVICSGSTAQIGAVAVKGSTYTWKSSPSGFASKSSNPIVNPIQNTTFYLTETITSTGCTKSDSVIVNVNALPDAGFKISQGTLSITCIPDDSLLKYYNWTFGDGQTATSIKPIHNYSKAGTYYVSLAVKDSNNCSKIDSQSVYFKSTGVENEKDGSVAIYAFPNPFKDYINLAISGYGNFDGNISITDMQGNIVYSKRLDIDQNSIEKFDLRSFSDGIYFIELSNNKVSLHLKVSKILY